MSAKRGGFLRRLLNKSSGFGVSYNLFNGEEHFVPSLSQIRMVVDYINVVVQFISNRGEPCSSTLRTELRRAVDGGLVDEVIEYTPDLSLAPQENEWRKRSIGLAATRRSGIKYYLSIDADEYYLPDQLEKTKRTILAKNLRTTAAQSFLHIKRPIWRSREPDTTWVCYFTDISDGTSIDPGEEFPVLVDPTRRIGSARGVHLFKPDEVAMFHMNLVRLDDLGSKLRNTSSAHMTDFIAKVKAEYQSWAPGKPLCFPGKPEMEIIEVPDQFAIDAIFRSGSAVGVSSAAPDDTRSTNSRIA